jgi:hypothetical protein
LAKARQLGDGLARELSDLGHLGHQARDGAVGDALDRPEGLVQGLPQRVLVEEAGDGGFELADLALRQGHEGVDAGEHVRLPHQTALVGLGRLQGRDLAEPSDQGLQFLLGGAGRGLADQVLDLAVSGDDARVDPVGLFQQAQALGQPSHRARIDDGAGHALGPQQAEGQLLISAARLHHHQLDRVPVAERQQRLHALGRSLDADLGPLKTDARVQPLTRNVHSTDDLRHGNLPCACDWKSSDCSVVRDRGGGPLAHPRLQPEGSRAPAAAWGDRRPPIPPQRRSDHASALRSR